ncbi:hypothetical protein OnM2_044043b [Erysiphe neolycopersici]|uniref:Uncharacterized protein n=1 Tax=Erysiphe neolycopersici TaxID=212602 RepID=A0A420HUU6_9PEZI|nr:hypothetical protein OnM2_044043b [Erysiphe neolycopersici]
MNSYPPHRTKVSNIVSQDVALSHLTAYLSSSETQPHLLPNAHLDPSTGPTIRSSNFSVTMHNLRRLQAGLRGEILAPTPELNDASGLPSVSSNISEVMSKNEEKRNLVTTAFENEETQISGHISNSKQGTIPTPEINDLDQVIEQKKSSSLSHVDKEVRKREKKLRRKELKKKMQRDAIDV